MNGNSALETQKLLAAGAAAVARGDMDAAAQFIRQVLTEQPQHAVALYLLGVTRFERRDWAEAESLFRQALALAPGQPKVGLHLAQTLRALQRPGEALDYCRLVLKDAPDHAGAWLELAKAQEESGAAAEAEASYRRILGRGADAVASLNFARLLCGLSRAAEAEESLRHALAGPALDAAMRARLEHQLGLTLKLRQQPDAALAQMQTAAKRAAPGRDQSLDQASLLMRLGRLEEAANLFEGVLAGDPLDIEVHVLLGEIRGRLQQDTLVSFDQALARAPGTAKLPVAKGRMLLKLHRPAEAQEAFRAALAIAPQDAVALGGLARALETLKDIAGALATHEQSLEAAPDDGEVLEAYAGFALRQDDARTAQALAEKACRIRPLSQGGLALLGLAWRARGDAREEWLSDYERQIRIFDLEPPANYPDMESFNRELAAYLESLHGGAQQYVTQTLRGGTQTHDEMFYGGHALADLLLPRINQAIQRYAAEWKAGADHPFTARLSHGFRYAGSWSSRLSDCGFHVNHIHQKGWISSCYYVALPDVVADETQQQGWIKFGEPSEDFGQAFAPRRAVQPKPGRLVLFPSYMWHGTAPFHAPQTRLTIAFDAVPA